MRHTPHDRPSQTPPPGQRRLLHRGDVLRVTLTLPAPKPGTAWLRTNLLHADRRRAEIVRAVSSPHRRQLAVDWHDLPMTPRDETSFEIAVPLLEVGRFEAKALFVPDGASAPLWPNGNNLVIKVEPADAVAATTLYNAFVRQFGDNLELPRSPDHLSGPESILDRAGYAVIPPSGTFRSLALQLDTLFDRLRFRILQLLPIHPVPTTFARMGRYGSPFAAIDFMNVDPALAEFDPHATPLDQFRELVDAVHQRHGRLFLDMPVNHTGWASSLQIHHPEWFARNPDGSFHSPEVWGVRWADLCQLDYSRLELWQHIADVFRFWCAQGVDGFRCDAGYLLPQPAWEFIVARVRQTYPDTLFLLEGLGGKIETTEALLADANLNWAYSELFQNIDQDAIAGYLPGAIATSTTRGVLVHFAETHDNNRLAARSPAYARMRTALSALGSHNGAFAITNGVEWLATEKVDVHGAGGLNWNAAENQADAIATLSALLETHAAFHAGAQLRLLQTSRDNTLALLREHPAAAGPLLVLVNLSDDRPANVEWNADETGPAPGPTLDLLTGRTVEPERVGPRARLRLAAAEVLCLTAHPGDLAALRDTLRTPPGLPEPCRRQSLVAAARAILLRFQSLAAAAAPDADDLARRLAANPVDFIETAAASHGDPLAILDWPRDARRDTMIAPGGVLLIRAPTPFVADLHNAGNDPVWRERSLPLDNGTHACFLLPPDNWPRPAWYRLHVRDGQGTPALESAPVLLLDDRPSPVARALPPADVATRDACALLTNGRGAMSQVRGAWGDIRSKYDAWLAANLDPACPVDRHIMLARARAWVVYRGYSIELALPVLTRFAAHPPHDATWHFDVPIGGRRLALVATLSMVADANAVRLRIDRQDPDDPLAFPQAEPVQLILRPDVDDRSNHAATRAFLAGESRWVQSVHPRPDGFDFAPDPGRVLTLHGPGGTFTLEPEWRYMVGTPFDAERGLDSSTDLFSPGFFTADLRAGTPFQLDASVRTADQVPARPHSPPNALPDADAPLSLDLALKAAMQQFIVRRDRARTVIAGYPWFLDWGRDTLIALRGCIAAGFRDEARDILRQFAQFEDRGTLPNMIRGRDSSNRDTSDAPLWFFVACDDLVRADGRNDFLDEPVGARSLRDVLTSIARHITQGTPNGIRMDPDSGLVFSPPHFTWMDTNHPAATPRQGYPIEIQALWFAALDVLCRAGGEATWTALREQVRTSLGQLYPRADGHGCADCLHAGPGVAARRAAADDALRPNQLLAVTLGAIGDQPLARSILQAGRELLVPGAIRSLADRPVSYPLPVEHHGRRLNHPLQPYWGRYAGDEDTRRKPAYHNGTAWTWLFPSYAEALAKVRGGEPGRSAARALLYSSIPLLARSCLGQIPEILDGDSPHAVRGCGAQAWGVTELYRALAFVGAFP